MLGFSRLPTRYGFFLATAGLILLVIFFLIENRTTHPVFETRLFRENRVFAFSNLAALINYSSTFAVGYLLSLYLQYIHNFPPRTAGLILISQPVFQALVSPLSGRASDRIDPRLLASSGMGLTAAALIALSFIRPETGLLWMVLILVLLGYWLWAILLSQYQCGHGLGRPEGLWPGFGYSGYNENGWADVQPRPDHDDYVGRDGQRKNHS